MGTRGRHWGRLCFANRIQEGRGDEADLVYERRAIGRDGLDGNAVEDVKEVACHCFPVFLGAHLDFFAGSSVHREHKLVAILLNDEAHELLSDIEIGLHNQEWIRRICARSLGVIEKVSNLCKGRLSEPGASWPFISTSRSGSSNCTTAYDRASDCRGNLARNERLEA